MLQDLSRVLDQFNDPRIWWVVAKSVIATVVLLGALVAGLAWLVSWLGSTGFGWLDTVLPWLTGFGGAIVAFLLLPLVVASVLGLLVDEVADAVETRWYPGLSAAKPPGVVGGAMQAVRLLAVTLALNAIALPFYLLLPGANVVIFLALNGYLFGREYFETVAARRMTPAAATRFRRAHRLQAMVAGMIIAGLALVPLVNLFVPVAGTAFMVHRVRSLSASAPTPA